jgi:phosphoglucomutase
VDNQLLTNLVRNQDPSTSVKFVNTSMHGVSSSFIKRGMQVFGFPEQAVVEVAEQKDPDPDFPTVAFPNPEEKG